MPAARSQSLWLILCYGGAVAVALAGVLAAALTLWSRHCLYTPYQGYVGSSLRVEISHGIDARTILHQLEQDGVIASATIARFYLVYRLGDPPIKAGEYSFNGPLSTLQVLAQLIRGEVVTHPVTIIEGLTLDEIAEHLTHEGLGNRGSFAALMGKPELVVDLDPQASDLEGYLFPDTYHFARGISEEEIIVTLVETFRRKFADEVRPLLEEGVPPTVRELVTLASIVEKEALLDGERAKIAGVYRNRLQRGIALHADPTIIYALKRLGRWDGNLRRQDLELDSPYNTYRHPGLPPGPIASPGLASLQAAARPADVPYLYFVSRNDGSHVFATTLAEHNRNVYQWQKLYWQRRWQEERKQSSPDG